MENKVKFIFEISSRRDKSVRPPTKYAQTTILLFFVLNGLVSIY
jgi:hypothetical protein